MPVFNSYTRPTALGDTFKPIDDNIQLLGAQTMYNRAEQNAQKIGGQFSNLFGVTTYGKDAEVLSQIEDEARKQIQEISKGNLENPETVSRVNSLISQYKNHPDVQAVTQRASAFQNEAKRKQEAEAKRQTYVSPLLREAEKYYSSGEYLTDKRFNNAGWVSPDTTKAMQEAVKMSTKKTYNPKTGYVENVAKPEEVSAAFYEIMKNNPNYQKDLEYGFQEETDGVNWDDSGQQFVQGKVEKLQQQYNEALNDGNQEAASLAQHELNRLKNLADPSLIGEELKKQAFQNHINTQLERVGYANDVLDFEKIERDPIDMKLLEHKLRMSEIAERETQKNKYKQAAAKSTDPLKRQMIMQAINLGYTTELEDPTQPDGLISTVELAKLGIAKPTETKEEKAAEKEVAKEDIASFRNIFNVNKNKAEKIIKEKAGDLGWNFDADDIEEVKWNKDSNRYEVKVDDLYTTEVISFTQDEMDKLNKIAVKKGNEIIEIPISDTEALDEAEKEGYTKQ